MKKTIALQLFFLIATLPILAQQIPVNKCGTGTPPREWEDQFQRFVKQYLTDVKEGRIARGTPLEIPVIVHVIHGGEKEGTFPNISAAQINSQIQILNDDYEGNGFNAQNIPRVFEKYKSDLNVKFMMATVDPTGAPILTEPGIHRMHYDSLPGGVNPKTVGYGADMLGSFMKFINDTIKKNTIWDPKKYLNIWLTDRKPAVGLLGFATFPENAALPGINQNNVGNDSTDGVWCGSGYFGLSPINYPYNMGRTASHEIGHWLGLRHIWGDSLCGQDYCVDTPPADTSNSYGMIHPWKLGRCPGDITGQMFMNFMDYSNDSLMYMFTEDQKTRVQTALANGTYRKDLGKNHLVGAVTVPIADYDVDTLMLKEKAITFTNTSLGSPTSYAWDFGKDAEPQTSNLKDPAPVTYSSAGIKMVSLTVTNNFGTNTTTRAKIVRGCSVGVPCADFEALVDGNVKSTIERNEAIYFKDISSGEPTSWSWKFEGGTPTTSTEQNPLIVYNAAGSYAVSLSIGSANGKDTIEKKRYVTVNASFNRSTAFTCIAIDSGRNIWAGTNQKGVFFLDKKTTPTASQFNLLSYSGNNFDPAKFIVQSIACDSLGNTWVAHAGRVGSTAPSGGMERIDYNNTATIQHYVPTSKTRCLNLADNDGLATRSIQCVVVDKKNTVWTAHKYHDLTSSPNYYVTPGGFSYKTSAATVFTSKSSWMDYTNGVEPQELPYPAYTCNPKPNETAQSRSCYSIACGSEEVWVSVNPYQAIDGRPFASRILRYDLSANFIGPEINFGTIGIPAGGIFNGIYLSNKGDAWVTVSAGKGFAVNKKGTWQYIAPGDMPCVFPAGTSINQNAIWGNKFGNVFIGTTKGLLVYNGDGNVNSATSYSFYNLSKSSGASRSVNGGVAENDSIQWIATDDGIVRSVIGRYDMTKSDIDYTTCNNADMNDVEIAIKNGQTNKSYHSYEVVTIIADKKTSSYPEHCTAEYVYAMLKKNASLTAPTPVDYPTNLLEIYKEANDKSVLFTLLTKSPFEAAFDALTTASLEAAQASSNPSQVISCTQKYKLYNNGKSIAARYLYDKGPALHYFKDCNWAALPVFDFSNSMDDYCGDQLLDVQYDPIWIFANDKKKIITNYTAKGHILYPGKIERTVVEECGVVKIITKGVGVQYCGDNCRGALMGKANTVLGKHLFKEVDKRLKTAFENGQ